MLICFHGIDRPGSGDLRAATRVEHLAFHADRGNLAGGPLLDENGDVCGSLVIFDAPDLATAREQMADDPYLIADLFESVSFTEFVAVHWGRNDEPTSS